MGHSYGLPTIKALFGQATHCAYPECREPLVFEDPVRGIRSIAAQIAHIRSEKRNGPRFDPTYPSELINSEENLLLLCGKHHAPVDQNESVFGVEELLEWKSAQLAQGAGTVVTDADLANLVQTLESTLSALYDALKVAVAVDVVGGRPVGDGVVVMPLEGLREIEMPLSTLPALLGVKVVNKGASGVDVTSAGLQFDVGHPRAYTMWHFDGEWCQHRYPHRLEGRSTAYWYMDTDVVKATIAQTVRETRAAPRRFQPFAHIGDDTIELGEWRSIAELPIWTDEEIRLLTEATGSACATPFNLSRTVERDP